ncbi:MAG: FKBP-type peptidyl-prolyl cis-trans isomerase [Bacteroidales bacterium]|nr:FKBP-type peptidyl-prolyl cis-trans isomerase [Bacteroidales bacterium]
MKVELNKVVSVSYILRTEENGPIVEQTTDDRLLDFLYGRGMLLPKFEESIANFGVGQKVSFHCTPEEGYGVYHEEMTVNIPIEVFMQDGKLNEMICHVGAHIPMQDNKGNHMIGKVLAIEEKSVKMDFNHDMAGKDLYFEVEVKAIREASEEEIEHGHVHHEGHCCHGCNGEGGCHKGEGEGCCHDHEDGEEHECCHKGDHDHEGGCCHKH